MDKFEMTKPLLSSVVITYVILAFMFVMFSFFTVLFISARNYKLQIINNKLLIRSLLYNTNISLNDIDIENVKVINLNDENIKIQIRTNGIGLPGLQIGWFSGNGLKYKLYLSDKKEVVSIPVKNGYTILFSSKNAKDIVNKIKM